MTFWETGKMRFNTTSRDNKQMYCLMSLPPGGVKGVVDEAQVRIEEFKMKYKLCLNTFEDSKEQETRRLCVDEMRYLKQEYENALQVAAFGTCRLNQFEKHRGKFLSGKGLTVDEQLYPEDIPLIDEVINEVAAHDAFPDQYKWELDFDALTVEEPSYPEPPGAPEREEEKEMCEPPTPSFRDYKPSETWEYQFTPNMMFTSMDKDQIVSRDYEIKADVIAKTITDKAREALLGRTRVDSPPPYMEEDVSSSTTTEVEDDFFGDELEYDCEVLLDDTTRDNYPPARFDVSGGMTSHLDDTERLWVSYLKERAFETDNLNCHGQACGRCFECLDHYFNDADTLKAIRLNILYEKEKLKDYPITWEAYQILIEHARLNEWKWCHNVKSWRKGDDPCGKCRNCLIKGLANYEVREMVDQRVHDFQLAYQWEEVRCRKSPGKGQEPVEGVEFFDQDSTDNLFIPIVKLYNK